MVVDMSAAVRIKVHGEHARFALVSAESDEGQELLEDAFDFLAEAFHRGSLLLDMNQVRMLCGMARINGMGILLDLR